MGEPGSQTAVVETMTSTAPTTADASTTHDKPTGAGSFRQVFESVICLAIAVILFRTFEVEGYMISTGSMAPTLLGYHKRVDCPKCGYHFAFGVTVDESRTGVLSSTRKEASAQTDEPITVPPPEDGNSEKNKPHDRGTTAVCPNCGWEVTGIDSIPLNQGDQLLVHKNAFAFHEPRRWDVAVFQNPAKPTQAYVKRIVGLPNESLEVIDGDVFIDGHICRKDFIHQRAMRILVFDNNCQPADDSDWQPRWIPDETSSPWQAVGGSFTNTLNAQNSPIDGDRYSWVKYRHWTRHGARGKSFVQLEPHEGQISIPKLTDTPVDYDASDGTLSCSGALSVKWRDQLTGISFDPVFQRTLARLFEKSHLTPVTDGYGYNEPADSDWSIPVRDLMISLKLQTTGRSGTFALEMGDGQQTFRTVFDFATREVKLFVNGSLTAERTGHWQQTSSALPLLVEMSLMDRQVLVSVDGHEPFAGWQMNEKGKDVTPPDSPVRFGVRGASVTVSDLALYRDVYYTHKGNHETTTLGPDEYYVLGDNSPISYDSRSWQNPAVEARKLIGKPLFLHLPSRPGEVNFNGKAYHIRIPDFSRIRYIR